jgi:hypothetical protein
MTDGTEGEHRDHLFDLGWNFGNIEVSSYGVTLELRARPYTSDFPGLRTLRISGDDRDDAIRSFLDRPLEVRVVAATFATFADALPDENTAYDIRVEPVSPLPGEEGDQWIITRSGEAALPFTNAANTGRTFVVTRREARLANMDDYGRRTPPMPSAHTAR